LIQDSSFSCLKLLVKLASATVDGGDQAIGCGADGGVEVFILQKEFLSFLGG